MTPLSLMVAHDFVSGDGARDAQGFPLDLSSLRIQAFVADGRGVAREGGKSGTRSGALQEVELRVWGQGVGDGEVPGTSAMCGVCEEPEWELDYEEDDLEEREIVVHGEGAWWEALHNVDREL
ncbi:hypothetical protein NDU88_001408 [Pleurodeles waltl]|uniref:Uncharacterized protein n=1 Tax=Pleurodeles waltl TaxID=8319 RepID=A0AAV7U8E6_PLEWA|nr:hypothetical protein NDU88_001408 [Pleurodeles waltl]